MNHKFKIKDYQIEPATSSVRLFNREFRLEPKVMSVLCLLAQEPGKVFSKTEILEHVWPNQIVDPELVTRAIFELRKLFCDDPKQPQYIKTIPRKGYILLPSIEFVEKNTVKKIHRKPFLLISPIILCVGTVLAASYWAVAPAGIKTTEKLIYSRNDSLYQVIKDPQNKTLAFVAGERNNHHIFVKDLNTNKINKITEQASNYRGLTLLNGKLISIRCQKACELIEYVNEGWKVLRNFEQRINNFTISPDGKYLALNFFERGESLIAILDLDTPNSEFEYTGLGTETKSPTFISNSELIYIGNDKDNKINLVRYELQNNQASFIETPLTRLYELTHINQTQLAIIGKHKNENGVWLYDLADNSVNLLKALTPEETIQDIHSNNNSLLINAQTSRVDIWVKEHPHLDISHPSLNLNGVLSTDSNNLYFASNRTGSYELWKSQASGSTRLSSVKADLIDKIITSKNSDHIAFTPFSEHKKYLVVFSSSESKIILKTEVPHTANLIGWSELDDEIFLSNKNAQSYDLMSFSFQDKTLRTIALDASYVATRNERGLIYYDFISRSLILKNQNKQATLLEFSDLGIRRLPSCLKLDGDLLYYCERQQSSQVVYSININNKQRETVSDVPVNVFVTDVKGSAVAYDLKSYGHSNLYEIEIL